MHFSDHLARFVQFKAEVFVAFERFTGLIIRKSEKWHKWIISNTIANIIGRVLYFLEPEMNNPPLDKGKIGPFMMSKGDKGLV